MGLDDLRDAINLNTICDIIDEEKKNDLLERKALVDKEILKINFKDIEDPLEQLKKLKELFDSNMITSEKYNLKKARLLEII